MNKKTLIAIAVVSCTCASTFANATVGYQFNGIGQYELGMSGAIVAAPGDAMTVISNPAGLAAIRPQGDASAEIFNPTRTANFGQGDIGSHTNVYGTPALGWMVPLRQHRFFIGGGFFGTAGLGVNYLQQPYFVPYPVAPTTLTPATFKAYSSISMMILALGLAWKPSSRWSLGMALDASTESVAFQESESGNANGFPFAVGLSYPNAATAYGIGVSVGMMYRLNSFCTLGASYRSPVIFTPLTWQEGEESVPNPATGGISETGGAGQYSMHLNYPQQIALGLALHPTQQLLISLEGQWINWRSTLNTISIYGPWNQGNSLVMATNWKNSWVGSVALQYTFAPWLTLRTGYSYGSNPVGQSNLYVNLLAPALVTNQVTFGATENLGQHWQLVEAFMHAFKNRKTGIITGTNIPISATLAENAFGLQVNYLF